MSKKNKRHTPEQIVSKLRDADVMLNAGKELAAVLQSSVFAKPPTIGGGISTEG